MKNKGCTDVAKSKALITAQLICAFLSTNAKTRFSHDAAYLFSIDLK